jgi:hypothetical protein
MTYIDNLQVAYTGLCQVLRKPQDFGLEPRVPQPLASVLERTLSTLGQVIEEMERMPPNGDLAFRQLLVTTHRSGHGHHSELHPRS